MVTDIERKNGELLEKIPALRELPFIDSVLCGKRQLSLSDVPIDGLSLERFVATYGTERRHDFGLEFMTEARVGEFEILNAERFWLPESIPGKRLYPSMEEILKRRYPGISATIIKNRADSVLATWREGSVPESVQNLEAMRKYGGVFNFNLFSPVDYVGTPIFTRELPYSVSFLSSLAYLHGSIIAGGSRSRSVRGHSAVTLPLPEKKRNLVLSKLKDAVTQDTPSDKGILIVKMQYSRLLSLLGMGGSADAKSDYSALGINYLEQLCILSQYLSPDDQSHARQVMRSFITPFFEHQSPHSGGTHDLRLQYFDSEADAERFTRFFSQAAIIAFPSIQFEKPRVRPLVYTKRDSLGNIIKSYGPFFCGDITLSNRYEVTNTLYGLEIQEKPSGVKQVRRRVE